jgi:hypothetical protein
MQVEMVQTSCGMAVTLYAYERDRAQLCNWATKQGEAGIAEYWRDENQLSIDGIQTGIVEKSCNRTQPRQRAYTIHSTLAMPEGSRSLASFFPLQHCVISDVADSAKPPRKCPQPLHKINALF